MMYSVAYHYAKDLNSDILGTSRRARLSPYNPNGCFSNILDMRFVFIPDDPVLRSTDFSVPHPGGVLFKPSVKYLLTQPRHVGALFWRPSTPTSLVAPLY